MMNKNKWMQKWLPPIVWVIILFILSSRPTGESSSIVWQDFVIKKTAHVVVYFVLTALNYRALRMSGLEKVRAAKFAIMLAILYAFTDEIHQGFVPGRESRLRDVGFDTIGSLLSIYLIWNALPKAPTKLKSWAKKLHLA